MNWKDLPAVCKQCQFNGKYSSGASCRLDKPCKEPPHPIKKRVKK